MRHLFCDTFLVFFLAVNTFIHAAETCETALNLENLVKCLESQSPEVVLASKDVEIAKANQARASQRVNPELEGGSQLGDKLGDKTLEISGTLLHTLELGGKRGARMELAQAELRMAQFRLDRAKEDTYISTVLLLLRHSQIYQERSMLNSALQRWSVVRKQLKGRLALTPEQRASLSLFEFAIEEAELQLSRLATELSAIHTDLNIRLGPRFLADKFEFPKLPSRWPNIDGTKEVPEQNTDYKLAVESRRMAEAELSVQRGLSWPDVKVGPAVTYSREGAIADLQLGFKMQLPLPVFHRNSGGRETARKSLERSQFFSEVFGQGQILRRDQYLSQFKESTRALKQAGDWEKLEKELGSIHSLYSRGVLPMSFIMESHRQVMESTRSFHYHQSLALSSFYQIVKIDGRVFETKWWE